MNEELLLKQLYLINEERIRNEKQTRVLLSCIKKNDDYDKELRSLKYKIEKMLKK